jgi:hypothetical protein
MRVPWKVLGLAGIAGVAATGVVLVRRRRAHRAYEPDELRERLHQRLAEARREGPPQTVGPSPEAGMPPV